MYFYIPNIANKTDDVKNNIAVYVNLAMSLLGFNDNQLTLAVAKEEHTVPLPAMVNNAITKMIASLRSPTGRAGFTTKKWENGLKTDLPAAIACQRTLIVNMPFIRKSSKKCINLEMLRDYIDECFGLKTHGLSPVVKAYIRNIINLMCVAHNKYFPGNFMKSAKDYNNVKKSEGLLAKMGYVPLKPNVHKVITVATADISVENKGDKDKYVLTNPKTREPLAHDKHFQAAARLLLPMISKSRPSAISKEFNSHFRELSQSSVTFYKNNVESVKLLNKAYAFVTSQKSKKSKTTLAHVASARGEYARKVLRDIPDLVNSDGQIVQNYMDVPAKLRHTIERMTSRRTSQKGSTAEQVPMNIDANPEKPVEPHGESVKTPQSKRKRSNKKSLRFVGLQAKKSKP